MKIKQFKTGAEIIEARNALRSKFLPPISKINFKPVIISKPGRVAVINAKIDPLTLADKINSPELPFDIVEIAESVLKRFPGVTLGHVRGYSRLHQILKPRLEVLYTIKKLKPGLTYTTLALMFGGRESGSVFRIVKRYRENNGDI